MSRAVQRHWLLDGPTGWRSASLDDTVIGANGDLELQPLPGSARPLVDASGSFGGLALPLGLAVDLDDRVYILDGESARIRRFDSCTQTFGTLSCIGGTGDQPRQLRAPRGIAISCRDDLYVADTDNHRVQVFALKGLALRSIWGPLQAVREGTAIRVQPSRVQAAELPDGTWRPWAIAVSANGWAFVTDYANGLVHAFDSHGRWRSAFDGSADGVPPLQHPTAIALDASDRLYIVQEDQPLVTVLSRTGGFIEQVELAPTLFGRFCPTAIAVDSNGNFLVADRTSRYLRVYCRAGDGCLRCHGPVLTADGLTSALAFDRSGNPLVADARQAVILRLDPAAAYVAEARYVSEPLDSHVFRCVWDRVALQLNLPAGAQVRVDTFTAESPKTSEEVLSLSESRWATGQVDATTGADRWDCLVRSQPGRYLWLRLTLSGGGSATPSIASARAYYPRQSSLQYLPAVYQADVDGGDFVGRFLSIFDMAWTQLGRRIGSMAAVFDPEASPTGAGDGSGDFLSWLASWIGLTLNRSWPEHQRRQLLKQAYRLFELRGTPEGLLRHVELYTGRRPVLLEHFKLRRWLFLGAARLGDTSAAWGDDVVKRLQLDKHSRVGSFQLVDSGDPLRDPFFQYAHQFTLIVPVRREPTDQQRTTLQAIIELATPAYAQGYVRFVQPRLRVGVQSMIGVDSIIGEYPDRAIAGQGRLGYDTVLGQQPAESKKPTLRIGTRARIGSTTLID
jgi:phage tail-like protein